MQDKLAHCPSVAITESGCTIHNLRCTSRDPACAVHMLNRHFVTDHSMFAEFLLRSQIVISGQCMQDKLAHCPSITIIVNRNFGEQKKPSPWGEGGTEGAG